MTPEEYNRLRTLFDAAASLPLDQRPGFVDANLPDDALLRAELLKMLSANQAVDGLSPSSLPTKPLDRQPGTVGSEPQIGRYKLLREIGRGGMGIVYLAVRNDDVFHKIVALKIIGAGGPTAEFIERFKRERQILAGLDHPHIARILDGGDTDDGRPFYVMEYVAGFPIDEYCKRVNAEFDDRLKIVIQVCEAIKYLHNQAIVHRDLKPSNILVDTDGRVKLLDFGIARVQTVGGLVGSSSSDGRPTMVLTPGYASPEQLEGREVTKSSDVYSIGVVLYQLLTGKLPFADATGRPDLAAQLSGGDPLAPSQHAIEGPRTKRFNVDLDRVVLTALKKQPAARYETVSILGEDLQRILDGRPVVARADHRLYQLRRLVGRNKFAAALAVLLVLVTIAGLALAIRAQLERVRLETREADLERFVALLNTRVDHWSDTPNPAPVAQRLADVQTASEVIASDTLRTLSARGRDGGRVGRVVSGVTRFLDRADALSVNQPPVRKKVALTYRQVGDFELAAPKAAGAGDASRDAVTSYQRAATIAASVGPEEREWATDQISDLAARLKALGASLDRAQLLLDSAGVPPSSTGASEAPGSATSTLRLPPPAVVAGRSARRNDPEPTPLIQRDAEADNSRQTALLETLRSTTSRAEHARRNLEALRGRLAVSGQTVMSEIVTALAQADGFLQSARSDMERGNLAAAEDDLTRASYLLQRVFNAVGF